MSFEYCSITEARKILGIKNRQTIMRLINNGTLHSEKMSNFHNAAICIPKSDIRKMLESQIKDLQKKIALLG